MSNFNETQIQNITNDFNNELKSKILQLDIGSNSLHSLQNDVNDIKLKYQNLYQNLDFNQNIYQQIMELIQKSFSLVFKIYNQQLEKYKIPKKQQINQEINNFLNSYQISHSIEPDLDIKIKKSILMDVQLTVYALTQIPSVYIDFFESNFLEKLENFEIIGDSIDLNICKEIISTKILHKLQEILPKNNDFIIDMNKNEIINFIQIMSFRISSIFQENKQNMLESIEYFKERTSKSTLINRFVIIGLLKELAQKIQNEIIDNLSLTFFQFVEPKQQAKFAQYIILNHDYFDMNCQQEIDIENEIEQQNEELENILKNSIIAQEKAEIKEQLAAKLGLLTRKIQHSQFEVTQLINADGHTGYLVEFQNGSSYLLHKNDEDKLVLVNKKYMSSNWRQKDMQDNKIICSTDQLIGPMKNKPMADYLKSNVKSAPYPDLQTKNVHLEQHEHGPFIHSAAGDIGSSLGYCLANINRYKCTSDFLKDFGYQATVNGSISYVIQRIPIIGTLLLVGGLGFQTLQLAQNNAANSQTKMNQLGKIAIQTGFAITSSFSGAFIGQVIIPVPIVGAFFGGIIGAIIGTTSGGWTIGKMNKSNFKKMINYLDNNLLEDGYWQYSKEILGVLGITNRFFKESIPEILVVYQRNCNMKDLWITINCYFICAFYYSTQELLERENNIKEFDNNWPLSIIMSQQWLYNTNIYLEQFIEPIENFIKKVIDKF